MSSSCSFMRFEPLGPAARDRQSEMGGGRSDIADEHRASVPAHVHATVVAESNTKIPPSSGDLRLNSYLDLTPGAIVVAANR